MDPGCLIAKMIRVVWFGGVSRLASFMYRPCGRVSFSVDAALLLRVAFTCALVPLGLCWDCSDGWKREVVLRTEPQSWEYIFRLSKV